MKCRICQSVVRKEFSSIILNKYNISYYSCSKCNFLQTENPYWLEEAYQTPINVSDTGYMRRNILFSKKLTILLPMLFNMHGKFLDYAGGYGVLVRLMRDIGFDFYWDDKYSKNLFSTGFEWEEVKGENIEAITSFESFEHFDDPMVEIEHMISISKNIIFTTELMPGYVPAPDQWWYYAPEHGQHISFYSRSTLEIIAANFGLFYYSVGPFHLFSEKRKIPSYKIKLFGLGKYGAHFLMQRIVNSKTWDDYLLMSSSQKQKNSK